VPISRIGDAALAKARRTPTTPTGSLITRVSAGLASPLGILIAIPGMAVLIGLVLTLTGERALRGSNLAVASERLSEQTRLVAGVVRGALAQAEPVLDRLDNLTRMHEPARPFEPFAHALVDLLHGRPGIAYLSASFPDGTFQGAYLDADGAVRFQDSRLAADGTRVRRYDPSARGELSLRSTERSQYDPRKRDFYTLAVARGSRVWTEPYVFYGSHATGITRTQPVFVGPERRLHAVITVDFDVNAMSSYLKKQQLPGTRALLYASDGTVLAYPAEVKSITDLARNSGRTLHYSDLADPVLTSFFRSVAQPQADAADLGMLDTPEGQYLSAVRSASDDPALHWFVAYLAPESAFLRGLHVYQRQSRRFGAATLALALVIGLLFARHITRVRREVVAARNEADAARDQARELGSYRLIECLGKGGMGEVWSAEHRLLARKAAIKMIRPEVLGLGGDDARARFRREAEALAALRSRNTIELFDYGVAADDTFFFVMELLDGMDLESLVRSYGPQPASRVVHLLQQVCGSLAEAHDAKFVHRDIKPANLYICRAGEEVDVVKVLDFGLVRAATDAGKPQRDPSLPAAAAGAGRLTFAGGMMGTPGYMPPEQALGRELDGRADLFAVGCVGVWLLAGRMVYPHSDPMHALVALLNEPPPDLKTLLPDGVPEELAALLTSCIAPHPDERPASARLLGRALRAIHFAPEEAWTEERAQAWWATRQGGSAPASGAPDTLSKESTAATIAASQAPRV
jgi:serine/threonine protein kinase